eukprot:9502667-Pyramimonas_sp.AAC.1
MEEGGRRGGGGGGGDEERNAGTVSSKRGPNTTGWLGKITTVGFFIFSAPGGLLQASGPSNNHSG